MSKFEVKIIEDTISSAGKRITTFQLKYWRAFHGELMTHRVFSRNASSSRAVPVKKMLSQVWNDPAMPAHWGMNQPGMQADTTLKGWKLGLAKFLWVATSKVVCAFAWGLVKCNLHKQVANRMLEPWQYIHVVLTATEFDNFFELRRHKDAMPEFKKLADAMYFEMSISKPRRVANAVVNWANWHLPYVSELERNFHSLDDCLKLSAARCARVSYLTHDNKKPSFGQDMDLYDRLVGSEPRHASPVEHQACAAMSSTHRSNNFVGWTQQREVLEKRWKNMAEAANG